MHTTDDIRPIARVSAASLPEAYELIEIEAPPAGGSGPFLLTHQTLTITW
jgi:hypothetical protein